MGETSAQAVWQAEFAPGGWMRVTNDKGTIVFLHVVKGAVHTAVMTSEEPIRAPAWRDVPFEAAEAFARMAGIDSVADESDAPLLALAEYGNAMAGATKSTPQPGIELESLFGPDSPKAVLVIHGVTALSDRLLGLRRPDGRITDEFLIDLAAVYLELAAQKRAPAPVIAEQTETPVRTVHRWIYEARKRGHLPAGRSGRAG